MSQLWRWDHHRNAYCFWSDSQQYFIYQDGTAVATDGTTVAPTCPTATSIPKNEDSPHSIAINKEAGNRDLVQRFDALRVLRDSVPSSSIYGTQLTQTANPQNPYSQFGNATNSLTCHNAQSLLASDNTQGSRTSFNPQVSQLSYACHGPQYQSAQPQANSNGTATEEARIAGEYTTSKIHSKHLDTRYHVRKSGAGFFKAGKVIKILWPEIPGFQTSDHTVVTDVRFTSDTFITKIRWFVVVKEGNGSCICLPIQTYGGRGCTKPGVSKRQHCVVYTTNKEPAPFPGEEPSKNEPAMLSAVKVRPRDRRDKMDPMARINFGKMYTIEHNVKVYDVGDVLPQFLSTLILQWQYVLGIDTRATQVESSGSDRDNKKVEGICEQQPLEDGKVTELELPANFAALWSWTASDHGQLVFQAGDTISITEYADSDWARGKNLRTGRTGVFPRNYVQLS